MITFWATATTNWLERYSIPPAETLNTLILIRFGRKYQQSCVARRFEFLIESKRLGKL
uniref:Uncharacterized protein n=1 Tax=Hyaloperonospora arabidopsidis (strain Emoy2) TaxID=559515 RepID=M4BAY6_HYAAE